MQKLKTQLEVEVAWNKMQGDNSNLEFCIRSKGWWYTCGHPTFNWIEFDYRIKP